MPTSEPKQWIWLTQPDSIAGMRVGCGFSAQWVAILPLRPSFSPNVGSSSSMAAALKPMPWLRRLTP